MLSAVGRQFSQLGASYLDVGVILAGRTWVTLQLRAEYVAQVGLTPQEGVYPHDHIYEIVLRGGISFANIRYVRCVMRGFYQLITSSSSSGLNL